MCIRDRDYSKTQNLILTSVIFIAGLSGLEVNFFSIQLKGMVLASVVAVIISLIFYVLNKFKLTNGN